MDWIHFLFLALLGSNFLFNNVEGLRAEKIVGGIPARRGLFKYLVAVMYNSSGVHNHNPCAGSILSDWFIATVAHCFYDELFGEWRTKRFYITAGTNNLAEPQSTARHIQVDTVTMPSVYNPNNTDNYVTQGNLAMVKLAESLELSLNNQTLSKLIPRKSLLRYSDLIFNVAAYGFQEVNVVQEKIHGTIHYVQKGRSDRQLRYGKAILLEQLDCWKIIKDNVAPGNMCAKLIRNDSNQPTGICQFDSGAPLVHRAYLDGIAINGFIECDEEQFPAVYIDVMQYYSFIMSVLANKRYNNMYVLRLEQDEYGEYMFKEI